MSSVQNIPPQFFKDLREKAIPLAITFLLGLPALGIMVPQVFTIIAHSPDNLGSLTSLFKLFTLIYFSFPLIVLVILVIFKLNEGIVNQLRNELTFFLAAIILLIFLLSISIPFFIKILLAYLAIFWFVFLVWKEITRIARERQKRTNIESDNINNEQIIDDNLDDFINFSIWFLYVVAQIIITIYTTVFYRLETLVYFSIYEVVVYAIPFLVYCFHPMCCKRKKPRTKLSFKVVQNDLNARIFFLTSVVLILINLNYDPNYDYDHTKSNSKYLSYFKPSNDLNVRLLKRRELIDIQALQQQKDEYKTDLVDSLNRLSVSTNKNGKELIRDSSLVNKNKKSIDMEDGSLSSYYDSSFLLNKVNKNELDLYKKLVKNQYDMVEKRAKKKLLELILYTQNKGIMVFLSILVILLSFLLLIFYTSKHANQLPSTDFIPEKPILKELGTIMSMLAGILLIAFVLFIPFIKPVTEKDIIASNPWGLFQLPNWNLTPTLPAEAEPTESLTKSIRDSPKLTDSIGKACCYCPSSLDNTATINTAGDLLFKSRIIEIRMAGLDAQLENIKLELNTLSQKISTITPKVSVEYKIGSDKNLTRLIESLNTSVGQIASSLKNTDTPLLKIADSIGKLQKEVDDLERVIQNYNGNQKRNINLKN